MVRLAFAFLSLMLIFFFAFTFKKTLDKLLGYSSILLPIIGLIFVLVCLNDILQNSATSATWVVLALSIIGIITGGKLFWDERQIQDKQQNKESEKAILTTIGRHGGRVTPIDIALETDLTVEEAEQALNTFCEKDIGERNLTPSGKIVYVFPDFISEDEKKQAQNPMDIG